MKHFEKKLLKKGESGKKFRLIKALKPVPKNYPHAVSTSVMPTVFLPRQSPNKRFFQEDEQKRFAAKNKVIVSYPLMSLTLQMVMCSRNMMVKRKRQRGI